jgi:CRISPR-associated endonuclease Cas1
MQPEVTASQGAICFARGYGLKIHVHRGHLVVEDGVGRDRRTRRYSRATRGLQRLVVLGHSGYVTLEAIRWLTDAGAALIHVDADGRLLLTSVAAGPDLAGLRRAQAEAASSDVGVELARTLLVQKVSGQRSVLDELPGSTEACTAVEAALGQLAAAGTLPELLWVESQAADAYWDAWSTLPIPFSTLDTKVVPEHWLSFGNRSSLLSRGPRLATNPPGAILNYLYALVEAEATLACHAVGLDPGVGIFHVDQRDRASFALDLMEAVRPLVDGYVLALLTQRTFHRRDFNETRQGACRLNPAVAVELAQTLPAWRQHLAPVVEAAAHTLADAAAAPVPHLTPLTRANQRAAWDRRAPSRRVRQARGDTLVLPNTCRDCGAPLEDRRRRYCRDCRRNQVAGHAVTARDRAAVVLAALRAEQRDPAHGGQAAQLRGAKNAAHQRANHEWTGEAADPATFTREILPSIEHLTVADIAAATGLSEVYCSMIRLGKRVPHPRHWAALATVADQPLEDVSMRSTSERTSYES